MIKVCPVCGKEFESKTPAKYCSVECKKKIRAEYRKKYYQENKEEFLEYRKKYYQENKEELKKRQNNPANKDKIRKRLAKYYSENKDKIKKMIAKHRRENKDKFRMYRSRTYYKHHEENLIKASTEEARKKSVQRAIEWRNNNRKRFREIARKAYYRGKLRRAEKEKKNIEIIESGVETIGVKWYPDKKKFRARLGQTTVGWYNYYDDAVKARERAERRYMAEQPKQKCILCGSSFRLRPRDKRDRQICHEEACEKLWKSYKMAMTGFKRGKRKSEPLIDEYKIEKSGRNE